MAKRKKRKQPQKKLTLPQRIQQAQQFLETKQFAKALIQLKALWKIEKNESIREALLIAYGERAKEMAAKGMYHEATILLERTHPLSERHSMLDLYVKWLIKAKSYQEFGNGHGLGRT